MSLVLFGIFAVITQQQFNHISNEKIYQARLDTYRSDERAYDAAVNVYDTCVTSIQTRDTYRLVFAGISQLFEASADLPAALFPSSVEAAEYQAKLKANIALLLDDPVANQLPAKDISECPTYPSEPPVKPER